MNKKDATIKQIEEKNCTGCSACCSICPQGAISMEENQEGFLEPIVSEEKCTDCGLCFKICPSLNPKYNNNKNPDCYAYMAPDTIRLNSASGGVFPVLAYDFIQNGGYVSGAIWDNDWSVVHIVSNKIEDIEKMRSSKHVQSKTNKSYKEIKKLLLDNKKVLFTGTPCQVAGLKAYLNKDYKNLYCVDIICHGVPSYKVFKKYLEENYEINDIKHIDFRKKGPTGWGNTLYIETKKTKKYIPYFKDSYYTLFSKNVSLRKSCSNCKFNKIPRQGDLTMADFWGVKAEYNDKLGTSVITINNNKGKYLLNILKQNTKLCVRQKLKCAYAKNYNLIKSPKENRYRDEFYKTLNEISLEEAKKIYIEDKCDCMILNFWSALNYGAILTCYGVQCLLEKLGKNAKVINYIGFPSSFNHVNYESSFAEKFSKKYLKLTNKVKNYDDFYKLNKSCDTFIVGSDQVWRKGCINGVLPKDKSLDWTLFFLDFVRYNKKKISYSASFGTAEIDGTAEDYERMNYYLQQFDAISVREDRAVELLNEIFGIESIQVIDSVFHIPIENLNKMTEEYVTDEKYIACFLLPYQKNDKWYLSFMEDISKKIGLPLKYFEFNCETSVEKWLAFIKNSQFVISDSYHGILFSIIFKKPFIQTVVAQRVQSRFDTVFRLLNIKDRSVFKNEQQINYDKLLESFNWQEINEKISQEKQRAEEWMKQALYMDKQQNLLYPNFKPMAPHECVKISDLLLLMNKRKIYFNYKKSKILSLLTFGEKRKHYQEKQEKLKAKLKRINEFEKMYK